MSKRMSVGDEFYSKNFGKVIVVEILPEEKASVRFEDGTIQSFHRTAIVKGYVKNYNTPTVLGVGFLGCTTKISKCRSYGIWFQMIERCYTNKYPAYTGCAVTQSWLNFNNFRIWYESQEGSNHKDYQLDKDILIKGNKLYSPNTCILVPSKLNKLLENSKSSRGVLPLGVSIHKQTGKFTARCCDGEGGYKHLGLFTNQDDAFACYKSFKEQIIKNSAEKHKDVLSKDAYNSLKNWEIEIND